MPAGDVIIGRVNRPGFTGEQTSQRMSPTDEKEHAPKYTAEFRERGVRLDAARAPGLARFKLGTGAAPRDLGATTLRLNATLPLAISARSL